MILNNAGYKAGVTQTAASLSAIKFCVSYLPAIFFVVGAVIMVLYIRFEGKEEQVKNDLSSRRSETVSE